LDVEGDIRGEVLLEALWDLAFGRGTRPDVFEIAAELLDQT